jgi:Family of unknown function (DUF5681)
MRNNLTGTGGFKPGQSGNPGGRPKVVGEIRALARQHTQTALKTLIDIAADKKAPAAARVAAAAHLLDRGYGRPETKIEATIEPREPSVFSELPWTEVARIIELSKVAGFEVREPEPELLEGPAGNGGAPVDG